MVGSPAGFLLDPLSGFLVASTAFCGIASGIVSAAAILIRRERSLLLFLIQIAGDLMLLYTPVEVLEVLGRR